MITQVILILMVSVMIQMYAQMMQPMIQMVMVHAIVTIYVRVMTTQAILTQMVSAMIPI